MADYYILDKDKNAVPCDLQTWARMFEDLFLRIVHKTYINGMEVSTVFLGNNHNYSKHGPPLIFESMVFGSPPNQDNRQERYSTYKEAQAGHWKLVGELIEEPMHKMGVSVNIMPLYEKHNIGITYYTVGYGTCIEYHTSLVELYYKMYENTPRVYISREGSIPNNLHYDICVEGTEEDMALAIQRLVDIALIYPFDKWNEKKPKEEKL